MKAGMRSQPVAPEEEILSHSPCVSPKARATRTAVLFLVQLICETNRNRLSQTMTGTMNIQNR